MKKFTGIFLILVLFGAYLTLPTGCSKPGTTPTGTLQNFAGTYSVFDACNPTASYNETVTVSGTGLTITNMGNHGTSVTATVSGSNLTIASQTFYPNYTVSGSGSLSSNDTTLNIIFTADSGFVSHQCNVIGTK